MGGAENNWGIIKKLLRKSKQFKNYEPNKSNWIVTKIKNKKVYKNDNESGVPAENIRIIVCLTRHSANLFHYRGTSYLVSGYER